jgi:hypothetical protein
MRDRTAAADTCTSSCTSKLACNTIKLLPNAQHLNVMNLDAFVTLMNS